MATIRTRVLRVPAVHAATASATSYDALVSVTQAARRAGGKLSALLAFFAVAAIAGTLIACLITPAVAIAGSATKQQITTFQSLPGSLDITPLDQKARIYAKSGKKQVLLASFFSQNRDIVKWEDIPATVKNATLAAEDIRFYQHGPVDPSGIARALVSNLMHKDIQGASTISQQYVKNVCVQQAEAIVDAKKSRTAYDACIDRSYNRKIREMRLAIGLEKKYDKDQILLGYLNIANFGGRTYGIEAAAQYYYDTSAKDLDIGQAATLISIVNNPEEYRLDKKANLAGAEGRRNHVLSVERQYEMITEAEYQKYSTARITTKITPPSTGCDSAGAAGFFCAYVVKTILTSKQFGKDEPERLANLNTKGWKIYTTLNLDLQKKAQKVMNTYVPMKSDQLDIGGAAVSLQVGTGRVLSMVQNKVYDATGAKYRKDFKYSAVNFNVSEKLGAGGGFQPGSTFKAINLIGWLESGHTINQVVNGNARPIPFSNYTACGQTLGGKTYEFKNDSPSDKGNMDVQEATARSVNGAFLSMAEEQDLCKMRDIAESMGAVNARGGRLVPEPSMAIGVSRSIAPIGMAQVFSTIANKGVTCQAIGIDKIVDSDGKSISVPGANCKRTVPANVAIAAGYDLHNVFTRGTMGGDNFISNGKFQFGKTGTTDDAKDTWAIGSSTKVTTAVWVGNRLGSVSLRTVYGGPACTNQPNRFAEKRHCVFQGIQSAMLAAYGGASTWPTPEAQFLYGGKAIVHKDAAPQVVEKPKSPKKDGGDTKPTTKPTPDATTKPQ